MIIILAGYARLNTFNSTLVNLCLLLLLNDYSGTLEPHISFIIETDESISFLSFVALFKNGFLLFMLFNLMPDTKSSDSEFLSRVVYGLC